MTGNKRPNILCLPLKRFAALGILAFALPVSSGAVEIFFSPSHDCENKIVEAISKSKKEVIASVYSINNPQIVSALIIAHKRGVAIRILTDRTQAGGRSSRALELLHAGVPLRVHTRHKIEHNKFGVFDDFLAINGSYNWTQPASEVNSENCAVMPEASAISAYRTRFEQLWEMNTEAKSEVAIAKIEARKMKREAASSEGAE